MNNHPQAALERQLRRLDRHITELARLDNRYTWARFLIFLAGIFIVAGAFGVNPSAGWAALLVMLMIFGAAVALHRRVERALRQFRLWREMQTANLARARLDWPHIPPPITIETDPEHPYALDLDITGERSLLHLLDTTVSRGGGQRLRDRLLTIPPDIATVEARARLVRELVPLRHFRRRLALDARLVSHARRWDADALMAWFNPHPPAPSPLRKEGESESPSERRGASMYAPAPGGTIDPPLQTSDGPDIVRSLPDRGRRGEEAGAGTSALRTTLIIASILAVVNIILFVLDQLAGLPPLWAATFLAYVGVSLTRTGDMTGLFEQVTALRDVLTPLAEVARRIERHAYQDGSRLRQVCAPFLEGTRPSVQLRRISRLAGAAGIRGHALAWALLNALAPWDLYFAYQLRRRRAELVALVPVWLDAWYEVETAGALANYADLNPACTFPTVGDGRLFSARGLGHPLIPARAKVRNDFTFSRMGEVALITGSNMSGKSSFLRTLGINLALAYAGGPVDAAALDTRLFRLYTCMRVTDSLAEGYSYFYAEVRRLRALLSALEANEPRPLFFLIDEIFRGTNNRERLIGSRAYVQALVGKRGVGGIATHDLELASLPDVTNYHFEDQVSDGQMAFDYRLRVGPSPTTNALKIMAMAGLPVE
jgi:hypothetical protein